MNKTIPIYKQLIIEDDDDSIEPTGVSFVALVDDPAIERNWMAFSKNLQKQKFVTVPDKQIISGPLMVADLPIYRNSKQMGEYYAIFDAPTILKIVQKYFKKQYTANVNKMHDMLQAIEGVYMFESYIIDRSRGVLPPTAFQGLTDGSWFGSYKVDNDQVWNDCVKTGEFKGFSVEGFFIQEPYIEAKDSAIQEIINIIDSIK